MSKHTRGQWEIRRNIQGGPLQIVAKAGDKVEDVTVWGAFGGPTLLDAEANARLMAAAPEMYQALKAFLAFYNKAMEGFTPGFDEVEGCDHALVHLNDARLMIGHFWDARDAIAKAEGRT